MEVDSLPAEEMNLVMEDGEGLCGNGEDKEETLEDQNVAESYQNEELDNNSSS
jgi:hypothetical protein